MKKAKVTWKVYGSNGDLKTAHEKSFRYIFSTPGNTRIIECDNFDKTGSHEFSIVRITRNTLGECYSEFMGQITDGIFENDRAASWDVVDESAPKWQFEML